MRNNIFKRFIAWFKSLFIKTVIVKEIQYRDVIKEVEVKPSKEVKHPNVKKSRMKHLGDKSSVRVGISRHDQGH